MPLSDLRFKREALERVASILEGEVSRQNPASSGAPENAEPPESVANQAGWIDVARNKALEYIARHRKMDLFPSQADVCGHVSKEMREEEIYSDHGKPLSASYIQRNSIQAKWWQANKP